MPLSVWLSWEPITVGGEPGGVLQKSQRRLQILTQTGGRGGAHLWALLWVHLQGEVLKGLHSGLTHFGRCHKDTAGKRDTVVIPAGEKRKKKGVSLLINPKH